MPATLSNGNRRKRYPRKRLEAFEGICATCRHLKVLGTGREFEKIIDTEFTEFACKRLEWKTREFYLMTPVDKKIDPSQIKKCPYWEPWTSPRDQQKENDKM